ncbi:hypothetical protein Taro_015396, partial [Colocasia esculenta]|nr:hypothetical protein [Colocasia esculenta]
DFVGSGPFGYHSVPASLSFAIPPLQPPPCLLPTLSPFSLYLSLSNPVCASRLLSVAVVQSGSWRGSPDQRATGGPSPKKAEQRAMVTMASMAPGLPTPTHHLICCQISMHNGFHRVIVLACILFSFTLSWLASAGNCDPVSYAADGLQESLVYDDDATKGCDAYEVDGLTTVYVQKNSQGCNGVSNVFARPDSFCFLTTLSHFLVGSDSCEGSSVENPLQLGNESRPPPDELLDGLEVSCFQVDINGGKDEAFASGKENLHPHDIASCEGAEISGAWMPETNGLDVPVYKTSEEIRSKVPNGSLFPHVNISPPFLDWGITHLYSPSKLFLTVANAHNESILRVYKPFSTNLQYYALEFEQLLLAPGEATSIGFVFLPRWLGSSSAHLVLQTNFGGFVINAKGAAIDSPYRIQSLVGFDVASDGKLSKTLSMFNPLDDVMYIKEVRALVSVSYENRSHTAHVVCQRKPSDQPAADFSMLPNSKKWFTLEHDEFGQSVVGIRPHRMWELRPHATESIMEVSLFTHKKGTFSGAICMTFDSSLHGKHNSVVIPLEGHTHDGIGYHPPSSLISVFLEPALPCKSGSSVFSLFVRNGASYLLRLVKIIEITDSVKLFEAKYVEGLILYPGTVTHVALVLYSSGTNSMEISDGMAPVSLNCKLAVVTNDSVSPQIEFPCEDLVKACQKQESISGSIATEISHVDFGHQHEERQSTNARTGSLGSTGEEPLPIEWSVMKAKWHLRQSWTLAKIEVAPLGLLPYPGRQTEDYWSLILDKWKLIDTLLARFVTDNKVLEWQCIGTRTSGFPATGCGPVALCQDEDSAYLQLIGSLVADMTAVSGLAVIAEARGGAQKASMVMAVWRTQWLMKEGVEGSTVQEVKKARRYATVVFGSLKDDFLQNFYGAYGPQSQNNLSGVEWLTLQGVGGFHSLIMLEGSKPVQKLMFDLDVPTNLNISSKELSSHERSTSAACASLFSKELYAKNAGEFPITVMKVDISGHPCGFNGFLIQNCKAFTLEPGESTRLLISFKPDFSAAVVHGDLELIMATGILVTPIKASLSMNMIKLCGRPVLWMLLTKLFLILLFAALVSVVFCALSHVSSITYENFLVKRNKTTTTINRVGKPSHLHRNSRSARSLKDDHKPEATVIRRSPDCKSGTHDKRMECQGEKDLHHQKNPLFTSSSVGTDMGEVDSSGAAEAHLPGNLTIRVIREKNRRKKRRAGAGLGFATKLEVSSSQSGNSTPSSPLSPGDCTPKQVWPGSPQPSEHPFARGGGLNLVKNQISLAPAEMLGPGTSMDCGASSSLPSDCGQPPLSEKTCSRAILLPSATFPGAGRCSPSVVAPIASTSTSPIAPHARAPGSKLSTEELVITDEVSASGGEYIYNIWGNHFCNHFLQRTREGPSRPADASEGDSQSFFAWDPQTLMMMSSARSVSPNTEQSHDVSYPLQRG